MSALTGADHIFIRAVELGCTPTPLPGSSVLFPMWKCACPDFIHAAHGTTIITRESIDLLQHAIQKRAAR